MASIHHASLALTVTHRDDIVWAEAAGEVDLATGPVLSSVLTRAVEGADRPLVLNLSAVWFLDCAGVDALLAVQHAAGGRFLLADVSDAVQRLFDIVGLSQVFTQIAGEPFAGRPLSRTPARTGDPAS